MQESYNLQWEDLFYIFGQQLQVTEDVTITGVEIEYLTKWLTSGESPLNWLQLWTEVDGWLGALIVNFTVNELADLNKQLQGPYQLLLGGVQLACGSNYWLYINPRVVI